MRFAGLRKYRCDGRYDARIQRALDRGFIAGYANLHDTYFKDLTTNKATDLPNAAGFIWPPLAEDIIKVASLAPQVKTKLNACPPM